MNGGLVRYDAMCRAIDEAFEVDEAKGIRDKAVAIEVYARQARNTEAERRACEIRLRAERKAGQLLASMQKGKGGRPENSVRREPSSYASAKRGNGITDSQAKRWQQLGAVPEERFEAAIAAPAKPSTNGIIASDRRPRPVGPQALWVWGRLRDFERDGLLERPACEVLAEMTAPMRADVLRLAGLVADWLNEVPDHA